MCIGQQFGPYVNTRGMAAEALPFGRGNKGDGPLASGASKPSCRSRSSAAFQLHVPRTSSRATVWFNGQQLEGERVYTIDRKLVDVDDANLLVIRLARGRGDRGLLEVPTCQLGGKTLRLEGRWQFRLGDQPQWAGIPLPARYGASTDILFEP